MKKHKTDAMFEEYRALIKENSEKIYAAAYAAKGNKACNAPKELLIVPGAIHGESYYVEPEKYETATKNFWNLYK